MALIAGLLVGGAGAVCFTVLNKDKGENEQGELKRLKMTADKN